MEQSINDLLLALGGKIERPRTLVFDVIAGNGQRVATYWRLQDALEEHRDQPVTVRPTYTNDSFEIGNWISRIR